MFEGILGLEKVIHFLSYDHDRHGVPKLTVHLVLRLTVYSVRQYHEIEPMDNLRQIFAHVATPRSFMLS